MKENTFEEQLNEILNLWFENLSEEEQYIVLKNLDTSEDGFDNLDVDTKYKVFDFEYISLESRVDFLDSVFRTAAGNYANDFSFAGRFISDMVAHAIEYEYPLSFFKDLTHGCQSGMIGILVYNSDCKRIYINNLDDMEEFKLNLEDELGEPITNKNHLPHYTFMCWLCYEELGFSIARTLFPNEF
ncbi:hypothetical protein [Bacteroides sp. 224]|uniref:DUF7222 domain-containing protein n=1 Tax=Bacteroides sp. 224 TaxID=2302936 RepID=UPI0013D2C848|nr:hypothetical protein [Bacteroides sp. 224]NDV63997.1 hypothetical protein [Bacteroides sp. 224]